MRILLRLLFLFIALIMLLSLVLAPALSAAACGETAARVLARSEEGRYRVNFGVLPDQPSLGYVRLVATVCDAATDEPVTDAQVTFLPTNPQGVKGAPILGINKFGAPEEFSAEIQMKQAGDWRYQVEVLARGREIRLEAPVQVRATQGNNPWAAGVFWFANAVILAGGAYLVWTTHRRRPASPTRSPI